MQVLGTIIMGGAVLAYVLGSTSEAAVALVIGIAILITGIVGDWFND